MRSPSTLLRIRPSDLAWRAVGDSIVILDLRTSSYLSISGSGTIIWAALKDEATQIELVEAVLQQYEVDANTAARDVEEFLNKLDAKGLVEYRSA